MAKELGRIGQRRYSGVFFEEFLPELRGAKGAEVYTEMADNDSTVGAILFAIENLMRHCEFTIEPAGNKTEDKKAAEFVQGCLDDMCHTWTDTLSEILSFITYGWSYHEIVYKRRMGRKPGADSSKYDDGLIGWKKLPIRSQETLHEWKYREHTDDLIGMEQWTTTDCDMVNVVIPIDKALHFVTRSRKSNPEGRSILRTAYRDWYFKKRIQEIEGVGIERDLAGFPTLTAPEGMDLWDSEDKEMQAALANAERIVTGIRRDSREGLVMPFGWELNLLSTGSRRQFDTNQIIERYNKQIATSVLTDFVLLGHESVGSFALADNKTKMFALAVGTYLDIICEVFNNQAIPRLIDLNGEHFKGITDYPYMKHGDIEDANLDKIGAFIQQMVGTGTLTPDDELEDYIRQIASLPERKDSLTHEERKGEVSPEQQQEQGNDGKTPKPKLSEESRREQAKERKREMDIDDRQAEREAEEAKKSLGRYDDIEKFNPYHDSKGRFSTADGAASMTLRTRSVLWQNAADKAIAREKERVAARNAEKEKESKPSKPKYLGETEKAVKLKMTVEDHDLESSRSRDVWIPKTQLSDDGIPGQWITDQKTQEFYTSRRAAGSYDVYYSDADGKKISPSMTAKEKEYAQQRAERFKQGQDDYNALLQQAKDMGIKGVRVGMKRKTLMQKIQDAQNQSKIGKSFSENISDDAEPTDVAKTFTDVLTTSTF